MAEIFDWRIKSQVNAKILLFDEHVFAFNLKIGMLLSVSSSNISLQVYRMWPFLTTSNADTTMHNRKYIVLG